jgi:hypothetical protein
MKLPRELMALILAAFTGCGTVVEGTSPPVDLSGTWRLSFSALASRSCPGAAARPLGCVGEGRLALDETGEAADGTIAFLGSCQACGLVADFSMQPQRLSGGVRGGRLELELGGFCRYSATIPAGHADNLSGEVRCTLLGIAPTTGAWTISRQE